jgi:hypothetical protein
VCWEKRNLLAPLNDRNFYFSKIYVERKKSLSTFMMLLLENFQIENNIYFKLLFGWIKIFCCVHFWICNKFVCMCLHSKNSRVIDLCFVFFTQILCCISLYEIHTICVRNTRVSLQITQILCEISCCFKFLIILIIKMYARHSSR